MKAALLTGIRRIETRQVPEPTTLRKTDVLVRVKNVGVCGSDIHYFTAGRIGSQVVQFPFVIGHEAAGVVERVGSGVTLLRPGQRVAIDPAVSCGQCDQCRGGRPHTCRELLFMGCPAQLGGCLAELIALPGSNCYPIPESMSFEEATLAEPLAIAVYSVERARVPARADIAVLGAGPIGTSVFHVLRTKSAGRVCVTDRIDDRLSHVARLNPAWMGNPEHIDVAASIAAFEPALLDIVFECSGDGQAAAQAVQLLKPGGTLVLIGIPEVDSITLPIHDLRRKEITIINIRRQLHCTQKALDLLASGSVRLTSMVTHRFPLEGTQEAFDIVAAYRDGVMKAMISVG